MNSLDNRHDHTHERAGNPRFVIVVSHPIQYYAPFYRALTTHTRMNVHAIFASRIGLRALTDRDMGVAIAWKTDLLGGYSHEFLPEAETITHSGFWNVDNPSVVHALNRAKPDVVLLHGYSNLTTLRALAWCRANGVPVLMISDSSLHIGTAPTARVAKAAFLPMLFAQYAGFLSIGDANDKYLRAFGVPVSKIFRVPNMVDDGFWSVREHRSATRDAQRARLGLTEHDCAFLFVGKLIPRKRPADIIVSLSKLKTRGVARHPVALFAGSGELMAPLQAAAASHGVDVRFLGFVNIDELPSIYCSADALVHPAEIETFGMIVLEAAILGLPLVLSDRVGAIGPTSIARPDENSLIYACGDIDALADAMGRVANDQTLTERLCERSLAISEELDWRRSVSGTLAAVDASLGRSGRRAWA